MNRRTILQLLAATPLLKPFSAFAALPISAADDALLDDLTRRGCLYFAEQASPNTGQVLDRAVARNPNGKIDTRRMASISATGFGLTALCIADKRGYQPHTQVLEQVRRTLRYHVNTLSNDHGFFSHFNDLETGAPFPGSEISSIDSAILFCGALTARAYFHDDAEIVSLATTLYNRADWNWMLDGSDLFSMGLRNGVFLNARWDHYCELMMIPLLALGSPTHAVKPNVWSAWSRPRINYDGFNYIGAADPLFPVGYSHAWFDFRNKHDQFADYFLNAVTATRAHQAFCLALGKPYSNDYWGISASDSAHGYTAWGGPDQNGQGYGGIDGSVVPCTAAGSLPFTPAPCLQVLHALRANYPKSYDRYGFCDAFHPQADWYDPDVLGIDLGIGVLMAENFRSGFVWNTFVRNPEVPLALERAGFKTT